VSLLTNAKFPAVSKPFINFALGNFQIQVCDWTGAQWISMFQEQAEMLLDATAQEIGESRDKYDDSFDSYFKKPLFKYFNFRIRAKLDTYNVS